MLNTVGDSITTWVDVVTTWASVEPLRSDELWKAQQVQANVSHRVKIRYREGITPDMRIVHKGRVLNISQPPRNIEERERRIEIMCKEEMPTASPVS